MRTIIPRCLRRRRMLLSGLALAFALLLEAGAAGAAPPGPGPRCMTDQETIAEAAMVFLFTQQVSANICDPILRSADKRAERLMLRMSREITDKFYPQFSRYEEARRKRFERWYGEKWSRALEIDREQRYRRFLKEIKLGLGVCGHLRREMEIVLDSEWNFLKSKLDFQLRQMAPTLRRCKIKDERGTPPPVKTPAPAKTGRAAKPPGKPSG